MPLTKKNETRTRVQVVTPRTGRKVVKARSRRSSGTWAAFATLIRTLALPGAGLVALILLVVGYNAVAGSRLFELRRVDLSAVSPELRPAVEQTVRDAVKQSPLLNVDLALVKRKIEEIHRVKEASVARMLPDGLYVRTIEREPVALVRRQSQSLVWLDSDAVEIGEFSEVKHGQEVPPILKGFSEGARLPVSAVGDDKERIALYKKIERELKSGEKPLWNSVDEIDLSFPIRTTLRLANSPVNVVVGNQDFRNRFETALKVLNAAREGDADLLRRFGVQDPEQMIRSRDHIAFMDLSRGDRIVYSYSTPSREKPLEKTQSTDADRNPKPAASALPRSAGGRTNADPGKKGRAGGSSNAKGK